MVKVVDKRPEEQAERDRLERLFGIAMNLFDSGRFSVNRTNVDGIRINGLGKTNKSYMTVYPDISGIRAYGEDIYPEAERLAHAYENAGEPKFTVEKHLHLL